MKHFSPVRQLLAACLLASAGLTGAAPLPGSLTIQATIALDIASSLNAQGGGAQAGTLSHVAGGVGTTSSFIGDPGSIAPASLSANLSATGDGVGALFTMSGSANGAWTDGLFADYTFSLVNASATETFTVVFRATISNAVAASGADAFAFSDLSVRDAANAELLATDYRVDTLNLGGDLTYDSANDSFSLTLAPGASLGFTALQRQRGGNFADPGSYSASLDAFLFVESVTGSGGNPNPNPVPEPGSLALVLLGAALLARRRRAG